MVAVYNGWGNGAERAFLSNGGAEVDAGPQHVPV
jgi:hypothetical protein